MKVRYETQDGKMSVEVEGTMVEVFEELGHFQEIFEDRTCRKGSKESDNVRFNVRTDPKEGDKYYELLCMEPGDLFHTKRAFSQNKKGTYAGGLYFSAKHKNAKGHEDGTYKADNGWLKWDRDQDKEV